MKKTILNLISALMSGVLALLGFSGCSSDGPMDMYGTPYGEFKVSGLVKDSSGTPLANARIIVRKYKRADTKDYHYEPGASDTVMTDSKGRYSDVGQIVEKEIRVVCEDPSGVYAPDSTDVKLQFKDADGMYMGLADATVDFTLGKSTTDAE